MALAAGTKGFTPPEAARGMRCWFGFLPAFWADEGDVIIVDDVTSAKQRAEGFQRWLPNVSFLSLDECRKRSMTEIPAGIDVWGWDDAIRWQLHKAAPRIDRILPEEKTIADIRRRSHRQSSIHVLNDLVGANDFTIGERFCLLQAEEVDALLGEWRQMVVKMPWSSSGRGVRYFRDRMTDREMRFVANAIRQQGAIIAEPWYDRVMDLAMEFTADGKGRVAYEGLSLFDTSHGAYTGNLLISEEQKYAVLSQYIDVGWVDRVRDQLLDILAKETVDIYAGPLGVDMMVVRHGQHNLLHPCVEINLRRTMGHVALSVARRTHGLFRTMRVIAGKDHHLLLE